jgi:hypothetical protein
MWLAFKKYCRCLPFSTPKAKNPFTVAGWLTTTNVTGAIGIDFGLWPIIKMKNCTWPLYHLICAKKNTKPLKAN